MGSHFLGRPRVRTLSSNRRLRSGQPIGWPLPNLGRFKLGTLSSPMKFPAAAAFTASGGGREVPRLAPPPRPWASPTQGAGESSLEPFLEKQRSAAGQTAAIQKWKF